MIERIPSMIDLANMRSRASRSSSRGIRRGRRRSGRRWRPLAGQILEGLEEAAAVKKTDESDDVAAGDAAAAVENLFSDVDAEAILAVALRAGAAAIDQANELDPSPLNFVFNAHRASALDQVAGDHGAAHDVSATSRPVRCLGFALADRTASAVIFHERRGSPPPSCVPSSALKSPLTAMGSPTFIERTAAIEASSKATTRHHRVELLTFSRRLKVENRVPAFEVRSSAALWSAPLTRARALIGPRSSLEGHGRRSRL